MVQRFINRDDIGGEKEGPLLLKKIPFKKKTLSARPKRKKSRGGPQQVSGGREGKGKKRVIRASFLVVSFFPGKKNIYWNRGSKGEKGKGGEAKGTKSLRSYRGGGKEER